MHWLNGHGDAHGAGGDDSNDDGGGTMTTTMMMMVVAVAVDAPVCYAVHESG